MNYSEGVTGVIISEKTRAERPNVLTRFSRQEEFKDRLEDLQQQFHTSKEELAKCKQEVAELEQRLQQKEAEIQAISKQVMTTCYKQRVKGLAACISHCGLSALLMILLLLKSALSDNHRA